MCFAVSASIRFALPFGDTRPPPMPLRHAVAFLFLAAVPLGDALGEASLLLVTPVYLLAFVALDGMFGTDPGTTAASAAYSPLRYRALLWVYIPAQLTVIAWGIATIGPTPTTARLAGLALAIGARGGIFGILAAHEMIHSRSRGERRLGAAMLAGVTCLHFRIAHLRLH